MREIQLHSRKYLNLVALVDDEDYERVNALRWNPHWSETTKSFYAMNKYGSREERKSRSMGAFILNLEYPMEAHHCNHDTLLNTKVNLVPSTRQQNQSSRKLNRNSRTGFKGVRLIKGEYVAQIKVNNKSRILGRYSNPLEAALRYDDAAEYYRGGFALYNFPNARAGRSPVP